mmetsp:Transcript_30765/g.80512  ORF Transcript_30765/g.80512 Transcript_30765/m.80512 type:complete len:222 (-) Transcript_30765:21-686(-)
MKLLASISLCVSHLGCSSATTAASSSRSAWAASSSRLAAASTRSAAATSCSRASLAATSFCLASALSWVPVLLDAVLRVAFSIPNIRLFRRTTFSVACRCGRGCRGASAAAGPPGAPAASGPSRLRRLGARSVPELGWLRGSRFRDSRPRTEPRRELEWSASAARPEGGGGGCSDGGDAASGSASLADAVPAASSGMSRSERQHHPQALSGRPSSCCLPTS